MRTMCLILTSLSLTLFAYGQSKSTVDSTVFSIDPEIIVQADQYFTDIEELSYDHPSIYQNTMLIDYYEYDSLLMSTRSDGKPFPFRSFYYERNGTLHIDGLYGLFGGFGFAIELVDGKPVVYHLATGDDFPQYSHTNNGELEFRLLVPCKYAELTLSKIPATGEQGTIYGRVEFMSESYYEGTDSADHEKSQPRREIRMDMEIYFKAEYLAL